MKEGKERAVARMMLKTLFSTTGRIFGPVTICFMVGLVIDLNVATKPWGMIIGAAAGIIIAVILVVRQLGQIRKEGVVSGN